MDILHKFLIEKKKKINSGKKPTQEVRYIYRVLFVVCCLFLWWDRSNTLWVDENVKWKRERLKMKPEDGLTQWFTTRGHFASPLLPPQISQRLDTFVVVTTWGKVLLVSNGYHTGQFCITENCPTPHVSSARVEKPWLVRRTSVL